MSAAVTEPENYRAVVGYEGVYEVSDRGSVRRRLRGQVPQRELARRFGVSSSIVHGVQTGTRWAHVS